MTKMQTSKQEQSSIQVGNERSCTVKNKRSRSINLALVESETHLGVDIHKLGLS